MIPEEKLSWDGCAWVMMLSINRPLGESACDGSHVGWLIMPGTLVDPQYEQPTDVAILERSLVYY